MRWLVTARPVDQLVISTDMDDDGWQDAAIRFIARARGQARVVTLTATEKTYSPAQVGQVTGTSKSGCTVA